MPSRLEYRESAFVGVAGNNLVHRRTLVPNGVGFRATRPADESREEFLASTDLWFRPVAFANGPEGALYIADLYREILDFSDGIPESIKRFKDLNRGNDRGRIYRVVPEGFRQPRAAASRPVQHRRTGRDAGASECVASRDRRPGCSTRGRTSPRSPGSCGSSEASTSPLGRLHALYALDGLDALSEAYVLRALDDADPGVREHGVRLSERIIAAHGLSDTLWRRLKARAEDSEPRVRYQLAFTLGEAQHPERNGVLAQMTARDIDQPWMHTAVLSSLADGAGDVFSTLIASGVWRSPASPRHSFVS